jgi:hypothetical protein
MAETLDTLKSLFSGVDRLVKGLDAVSVPRVEDLPYWVSPPIQFVYESNATLSLGTYTWNDAPTPLTPDRPLLSNAMYFFRSISLSADLSELDYETALTVNPQFYTFLRGDSKAILFREPIQFNKFYNQFDYRMFWIPRRGNDQLLGAFRGTLVQTPALIGKVTIELKAVISAQEIVHTDFIKQFTNNPFPGDVNDRKGRV